MLLLSFSIPLILFKGSIDDFAPRSIAIVNDIIAMGNMPENYYTVQVPGYYLLGTILILISRIPEYGLLYFPIQIIPYGLALFFLMYKISGNRLIAGLIVLIDLISGTTGTSKVFFWPHGVGNILFYILLIVLMNVLDGSKASNSGKYISLILISSALVFISYDLTAYSLIFVAVLLFFLRFSLGKNNTKYRRLFNYLAVFFLIIVLILLSVSQFIQTTFIPMLKHLVSEISAINKFIISYLSPNIIDTQLKNLFISYPRIISVISGIKYLLLLASIILFIITAVKAHKAKRETSAPQVIVLSIIITAFIYGLLRFIIGQIPVTGLFFPGILCVAWLSRKYKRWSYIIIMSLLVLTPLYYFVHYNCNLLNNDLRINEKINSSALWLTDNGNTIFLVRSDELTKNLILFKQSSEKETGRLNNVQRITSADAVNLTEGSDVSPDTYFIINYKLNTMSLDNWIIIKSWNFAKEKINSNYNTNKTYDNSDICIYAKQ
jgi:hypothetical protein